MQLVGAVHLMKLVFYLNPF